MSALLEESVPVEDWKRETVGAKNGRKAAINVAAASDSVESRYWESIIDRIVEMQHLGEDWDGLGAKAPASELLESAIGLAYLLKGRGMTPPARVVASTAGTVIFEWQTGEGFYGEVEIDRPMHADVMMLQPGQPAQHWELPEE